ncbi:hypothetical protein XELAEV_18040338mg [Xenopus laevis]|uniref:Uncharacterized protein n=1 Tax=Xenopus laevis TaxID=8355 RepID=A0A974CAH6_XENLA|nr:hypothetical protein XELAEV_18040338mg [Xenopus laevis]
MGLSTICLVALLSLLTLAHSAPDPTLDSNWQLWVKTHQKTYKDAEEENAKRTIWEETVKFITVHNLEYSLGLHTYEVGMNYLGDMTGEEVAAKMTGYISSDHSLANMTHVPKEILGAPPPASIDWRTQECVTPVRNQYGLCGSCYAFSTVGALECQWKKKTGSLVTFSPQELVDCSYIEGNNGCKGGTLRNSFEYMKKYGLMEESKRPYKGKTVVGTIGPVSVAIDSTHQGFRMYRSGVYSDQYCTTNVNHAVLVVGYGTDIDKQTGKSNDYWLVKNR